MLVVSLISSKYNRKKIQTFKYIIYVYFRMKKIVEIDDELFEKLEKIRKDYHIKTVSPVISLVLTLGVKWFEKLNELTPTMNVSTPIPWPMPYYVPDCPQPYTPWWQEGIPSSYPWEYKVFCSDGSNFNVTGIGSYTIGDWEITSYLSGASFNYVG